jgi:predicted  nucleic acid-binding Zn-ribbon protein
MAKAQSQSAQAKPASQIDTLKTQLQDVRTRMADAKRQHENNLDRARELRDLLNKVEKAVLVSDYETLANEEAALMARLAHLEAEAEYEISKNHAPLGSK